MNFFQHQDQARRRTGVLLFYYILALLFLIAAFYALVVFIVVLVDAPKDPRAITYGTQLAKNGFFDPLLLLATTAGVGLLVGGASAYKLIELSSGGGDAVAQQLGGRIVSPSTRDPLERRLLNIVEEMSIASGINVPNVYILDDEPNINAFAAGLTPNTAALGITRGSLEYLNRDELQGVVGHEFSHILNGDMRINLRLIGILFGLNLLIILGSICMRIAFYSNLGSSSDSRDKSGAALAIIGVIFGIGCMVIGGIGMFFSSLIQAAISRQREYLADASAVQFTRNPAGISGALKKIGCPNIGSRVASSQSVEASHMFIANIFGLGSFSNLYATHPPLDDRIRRIDPSFNGRFPEELRPVSVSPEELNPQKSKKPLPFGMGGAVAGAIIPGVPVPGGPSAKGPIAMNPVEAMNRIGQLGIGQLVVAAALNESIPQFTAESVRYPLGAKSVLYALLLDSREEIRNKQLAILSQKEEKTCFDLIGKILQQLNGFPSESRIPLVQKSLPALRQLSPNQYANFRRIVEELVAADSQIDLFEYTLRGMLLNDLDIHFGLMKPAVVRFHSISGLAEPLAATLSYLAYSGHEDPAEVRKAFDAGMKAAAVPGTLSPRESCSLPSFDTALKTLATASMPVKQKLIAAYLACIASDGSVVPREGELLRAISATFGCPMPPLG